MSTHGGAYETKRHIRRSTVEQELLALEKEYWQAIKNRDADTAVRLSDDPCIVTGAQGVGRIGGQALAGMMKDIVVHTP